MKECWINVYKPHYVFGLAYCSREEAIAASLSVFIGTPLAYRIHVRMK